MSSYIHFTLFLNSPLNANWFSGFPSGILYILNQSTVASRYPGLSLLTSSISVKKKWWHAARAGNRVPGKFRLKFLQKLTIKVCSFRILNINHNHFPVCFFFIYQCKNSQHFHPDDFSTWADLQKWVGGILGDRNVRKIFKGKLAKNHLLTHLA